GVDAAVGRSGAGRRPEVVAGHGAEVVGDEVDGGVLAVDEADVAVGADGCGGDVGVDGGGCEVDVAGGGWVGDVAGDELAVAGAGCADWCEVDEGDVAGRAGKGETDDAVRRGQVVARVLAGVDFAGGCAGVGGEGDRGLGDRAEVVGDEVDDG